MEGKVRKNYFCQCDIFYMTIGYVVQINLSVPLKLIFYHFCALKMYKIFTIFYLKYIPIDWKISQTFGISQYQKYFILYKKNGFHTIDIQYQKNELYILS